MAAERAIAPNSLTGVSMLIGCCAAAWFSGGSLRDDTLGVVATVAWVLARLSARQLATVAAPHSGRDGPGVQGGFGWLYAVCATAAECAIYCGIAVGAQADGWTATWPLALATVIAGSVAALARACVLAATGQDASRTDPIWRRLTEFSSPPVGLAVLLAVLIMIVYGPRIALFAVLAAEVASLARTLITATRFPRAGTAGRDLLIACRDDGPLARRAGWLVRGNLMPVPPALAGLIAVALLAALGISNLPGVVALTPVAVLLLAALGSSHPHDGRRDWMAPVLLCIGQYTYLAAVGAARSVPWLVVYIACSMIAVWYASLIASPATMTSARHPASRNARIRQIMARPGDGIGWDGRVCLAGLTGMFGVALFGYLGLVAYLGALILRKVAIGYLMPGEDRRR